MLSAEQEKMLLERRQVLSAYEYQSGQHFQPVPDCPYRYDYQKILLENDIACLDLSKTDATDKTRSLFQFLCKDDLFFLLYFGMERRDVNHIKVASFVVRRCNEVQQERDRTVDLWARGHYKSSIINAGVTIQDVFKDSESATGIFSHNRPIAKGFLGSIRTHLENPRMVSWFPDILYDNPDTQAPSWGLDSGLTVKRKSARPESTVEAWGLVDAMPTSKHFTHRLYDDVVDQDTVGTKDQIDKANDRFKLSHNLKSLTEKTTMRVAGTIYRHDDPYQGMIQCGDYRVRIQTVYGGTNVTGDNGVILTKDEITQALKDMGPYVFSTQLLLQAVLPGEQKLKVEWMKFYETLPTAMNVYFVCDPANEKKRSRNHDPDYTVLWVVGYAPDGFVYVLDGVRDRLNLEERWKMLAEKTRKWKPRVAGYEKYGKDSDIQHFEYMKRQEKMQLRIVELGGSLGKEDRIKRLVPRLFRGQLLFPKAGIWVTDRMLNQRVNLVQTLVNEEMSSWPYSQHDDMLDALSRIEDREQLQVVEPYEDPAMRYMQEEVEEYGYQYECEELLI